MYESVQTEDGHGGDGTSRGGGPIKVLMVTARYLPETGGTEIHTHEVAQRLTDLGVDVVVLSTALRKPPSSKSFDGRVRVLRVRAWPPSGDLYFAPRLARAIRSAQVDLVHCQGYHTLVAPFAMLAALRAHIPYVVTFHSGGHGSALRRSVRPLQAWLLRPLLKRAARLIAVSEFEADLFARRLRIWRSAIEVIPSGVNLPHIDGEPALDATPLPQIDGEPALDAPPLILSVGRLERYKGHHRVLEAVPVLNEARPGTRLRIVGSGPEEPRLRLLAARLGVEDLVEIGPVRAEHRKEMGRLLRQAGAVALLSDYESQGLSIQEALALGRPLLISHGSALAELTRFPNVHALPSGAGAQEVASAILELLDAQVTVPPRLPTWEECAAALLSVYEEALARAR